MQKRTREIIALVLLIVLGIGGISAMAWYILVGHNWNAAATSIDDRIGNMDGYTVILCEGAVPSASDQQAVSVSQPMLEEENFGVSAEEGDSSHIPLTIEEAIGSYREKGAQVVTLLGDDPGYYSDPIIIPRNGRRIAIFSVDGPRPDLAAKNMAKSLAANEVDFTVCLIDDLASVEKGLGRIDLAFCLDYDDAGSEGRYIGNTYVVGSPYEGHVAAVIMASSGFLSSKMVDVR